VNEGDLALNEATNQHLLRVANGACDLEDEVAARVRPPAAADALASDGLSERGNWTPGGLEDNAVLANKGKSLTWSHLFSQRSLTDRGSAAAAREPP
jgi:hypothetical protein